MCRDLIKLGCVNNKSLILKFPNDDIIPKHLIRHFIRGYFDGDGCVYYKEGEKIDSRNKKKYKYKRLMVSIVGTESFLNSLIDIFKQHNINFKFDYSSNCGKAFEIRLYKKDELFDLYDFLYRDETICLNRKYDKFQYAYQRMNVS
jgi:intein-encoded DNA endonuclease-like protein